MTTNRDEFRQITSGARLDAARNPELITVAEAARFLKISVSTIWRWINAGKLVSYRIGPKAIRIKRADLDELIAPARASGESTNIMAEFTPVQTDLDIEPLTEEEIRQGLQAMREARQLRERMRRERGGTPLPDSVELIRAMREERSRYLDQL